MSLEVELCLIGTAQAENLGGVARLCDNFGVAALTLVAPRVAVDDPRAQVVARTAREKLAATRVTADLDAAVRECVYVVGFSARRGDARPMVALGGLAAHLAARAPAGRVALVFGPEDAGLSAADVGRQLRARRGDARRDRRVRRPRAGGARRHRLRPRRGARAHAGASTPPG